MDTALTYYQSVRTAEDLKAALNTELTSAAVSFVKIGYLLKLARDGEYLKDTEYENYTDFAYKEFGLDKSQVSRFIKINDRFSISGYSEHLEEKYQNYGSAKLSLMLTLPDEINEELSPEYSKSDIQAIKEDYEAEQAITPIEVMTEAVNPDMPDDWLEQVVKQLGDEHPETIRGWYQAKPAASDPEDVQIRILKETYMPDGDRTYDIRIPGQGRYMISMKSEGIMITSMRDPSIKSPLKWSEFLDLADLDLNNRPMDFLEPEESKDMEKKVEKPKHVVKSTAKTDKKPEKPSEKAPKMEEKEQKTEDQDNNSTISSTTSIEKVEGEVIDAGQCTDNAPQDDFINPPVNETVEDVNEAAGEELDKDQQRCIVQLDYIKFAVLDHEWTEAAEHLIELRKIIDDKIDGLLNRE